jgi:hypothetical protein
MKGKFYSTSIKPLLKNINSHCGPNGISTQYTFYNGVTFNEREDYQNMFSFVPAKIYDEKRISSSLFELPALDLDFFNKDQVRGINTKDCSLSEISDYWEMITLQIRSKSLLLANFNSFEDGLISFRISFNSLTKFNNVMLQSLVANHNSGSISSFSTRCIKLISKLHKPVCISLHDCFNNTSTRSPSISLSENILYNK